MAIAVNYSGGEICYGDEGEGSSRHIAEIYSRASGIDKQGYERCERREQNQSIDENCPALSKTTLSPLPLTKPST